MTFIYNKPVPGTTLKKLIEQDAFLREFMDMMRRRLELDKQYAENLRELRASANPQWAESAVQPVVSPFLTLLDKEINLRENTTNALFTTLNELPPSRFPDEPDEEGIAPTTKYKELQTSNEEYLFRFQEVNTPDCIASLQAWYKRPRIIELIEDMTVNEIRDYVFPEVDRKYRESVVNQRRESQRVSEWHKTHLPRCLDTHQQRIEDIKLIVDSVAIDYSRLASQPVQAFAVMTNAVSNISSSKYIAPLHASQEPEMEHVWIQPAIYRNFYTDGQAAQPVFGLPLSEDYLDSLSRSYHRSYDWRPLSIADIFRLEEKVPEGSSIQNFRNREDEEKTPDYVVASLFTIPPLIRLPVGLQTQKSDKWPRNRLQEPMKMMSNLAKRHLEQVASNNLFFFPYEATAALWFHGPEGVYFLKAVRRKWDFKNDCPLPDGVVRKSSTAKLVWKKTKEDYSSP